MKKVPIYENLLAKIAILEEQNRRKDERIAYLERLLYGAKSDRIASKVPENQPMLFDEFFQEAMDEKASQIEQAAKDIEKAALKRRQAARKSPSRPAKYRYSGLKSYATWDGSVVRGSRINKLLYAKDIDIYFIIRAVEKTLVVEHKDLPNLYSYKCILQPVNLFGGRIVDDSEDADENEIEFVPAWIDFTDNTYGRCLFLSFSGYDENSTSGDASFVRGESREERKKRIDDTFYQTLSVQNIKSGEKNKKNEFYDKIYIGWWDAAADYNGKLPYPYTEDVVIADDWSNYFRPHTNLRLNNKILNQNRKVYQVNPKQKATFKFLSDTIPNPRSLFIIRGKRYVCEKLTATFTSQGMSQLIKGSFYPVTD